MWHAHGKHTGCIVDSIAVLHPVRIRKQQSPNMTNLKRKIAVLDTIEEEAGKRQCTTKIESWQAMQTDSPNSTSSSSPSLTDNNDDNLPVYIRPSPNLLSVFAHVQPFADGLRECGILDRFDYTNLRKACRTTAIELKPYPYDRARPDTKEHYFAGIQPIKCSACAIGSDKLVVKPCGGRRSQDGCKANLCLYSVMKARRDLDQQLKASEMHYCRHCTERLLVEARQYGLCQCGDHPGQDTIDLLNEHWLCGECHGSAHGRGIEVARGNLLRLEAAQGVCPRDWNESPDSGLLRWIAPDFAMPWFRNNCPGCGCDYGHLIDSYAGTPLEFDVDNLNIVPQNMMVQCMICLRGKAHRSIGGS